MGIFVGHSPDHASDVALVLNPRTGLVSPQYHVVFDDSFSTIGHLTTEDTPPNWYHLVEYCCENYTDSLEDTLLIDEVARNLPNEDRLIKNRSALEQCLDLVRSDPVPESSPDTSNDLFVPDGSPEAVVEIPASEGAPLTSEGAPDPVTLEQRLDDPNEPLNFNLMDLESAGLIRSRRKRNATWMMADPINRRLKSAL